MAQDQLSLVQAENDYRLSLLDLSQLLELPSPDNFRIVSPGIQPEQLFGTLTPPAEIYSQALLTKPSIKAAQYRLERAARSIRIAQSAYYPQLNFGAGLGTSYYNVSGKENPSFHSQVKDNFSQYVGLSLSIPIFNRLSTRNRVRTARLEQTTLNWQLEETKKKLYKEIQQAWYNAAAAESKYTSSHTATVASEESFKLMSEKYENGKANAVEYNEAKQNLMKSQSDELQAKYDYLFRTKILDFYKGEPIE